MGEVVKALTVWQPWADLIVRGLKPVEFRNRRTRFRGPVAIHAGRHKDLKVEGLYMRAVYRLAPFLEAELGPIRTCLEGLPRGAIVGAARLFNCEPAEALGGLLSRRLSWQATCGLGLDFPGYGWVLKEPVLAPFWLLGVGGRQGLWDLQRDLDQVVEEWMDHDEERG